jgi:secreted trypsin-like serine protease
VWLDRPRGADLRTRDGSEKVNARGYGLALLLAMLLALGSAVPVFAAEEPAPEDEPVIQPQIVGGEPVPDGKYKFVAALRDTTRGNSAYQQQFCGGSLIDRDSVLTAAHCVEPPTTAAQLRVSVGINNLLKPSQGQTRSVAAITLHPQYIPADEDYDVAVLTLSRPVTNIAPARIPATTNNNFETPGRMARIAGWGSTVRQPSNNDPNYPVRMQETRVPIVSDNRGEEAYGGEYTPPIMLAAGREGKDTCQGDSGGPIFVKQPSGRVFQIGITSFGNGCGARGFPGVYAEANNESIRGCIYDTAAL